MVELCRKTKTICPQCGATIFQAIPNQTSIQEIRAFHKLKGNKFDAPSDFDWIHPGEFCTKCDWGCLHHHTVTPRNEIAPDAFTVQLLDPGPKPLKVMALIREYWKFTPAKAKEIVNAKEMMIGEIPYWRFSEIKERFEGLGARILLEPAKLS